jgi:hypothetical protein
MSHNHGPKIVTSGLSVCLDAANVKSFAGEPTVNLALFDAASWFSTDTPANVTQSIDTSIKYSGRNSLKIIANNGYWNIYRTSTSYYTQTSSTTFTLSWKMKRADGAAPSISGYIYTVSTPTYPSVTVYPIDNGWYQCYCSYNSTNSTLNLTGFNSTQLGVFYITDWQVETKTYPTVFVYGTRGSTVATNGGLYDLSQSGNHGVLNGTITYNGGAAGNMVLDGSSGYVSVPALSYSSFTAFTFEIVFKSTVASNSGTGFLIWDHSGGNPFWLGKNSSNNWYLMNNNGPARGKTATGAASFSANQWVHVVCRMVFNDNAILETGNFADIIVNNVRASTSYRNDTPTTGYASGNIWLGRYGTASGNGEIGSGVPNYSSISIGYFKVYNRALTITEIASNFNRLKSRYNL